MTGKELKQWRGRAGLTQVQLSERLGVTSSTVARWERDEVAQPPYLDLALKKIRRETLPEYLRRVMRENGLSIRDVSRNAERAGETLSAAFLSVLIQGTQHDLSSNKIRALAVGLNRPVSEITEILGITEQHNDRDPELEAIQFNYSRLPRAKQQQARFLIELVSREIQRMLKE